MKKENSLRISFLPKFILASVFCIVALLVFYPDAQKAAAEPKISIPPGATYVQLWNQVDSLADSGLYRSAHELADLILEKARTEKQDVHLIKALVCRYKMAANYEEENDLKAIYDAEAELKQLKFPAKQVLHSMLAEMYWDYYTEHRWTIFSRSKTTESINDSINTWDVSQIVNQTIKHYQASLLPSDSLKKIPLGQFDELLEKEKETRALRPTLFDFLTHRAISFYQDEEPSVTRPAERFSISSPAAFGDLKIFNNQNENFPADDTFALRYYAYKSYQKLLEFRLRDTATAALIDADRLRIQFVFNNYSGEKKNELYETALRRLANKYPKNPESGRVLFVLAQHFSDRANSLSYMLSSNPADRWKYNSALALCDSIIAMYPKTNAADNAELMRESILKKEISFTTEEVIVPRKPFPALLSVRNTDSLYFRICAINPDLYFEDQEKRIAYYLSQPVLNAWPFVFPLAKDHQDHSSQIIIPALASGNYVLLASSDRNFDTLASKKQIIAFRELQVSNIAYLKRKERSSDEEYLLINRENGSPLAKASVEVLRNRYNSTLGRYEYVYAFTETADKDGRVVIKEEKLGDRDNYVLDIRWKGEYLRSESQYNYDYDYEEPEKAETFFFLDRAIYRPGQTVYFKGIVVDKKKSGSNILTNFKSNVELLDPNSQVVQNVELTTNEYGSFSGSFVLPNNGITGMMQISDENGSIGFSMEEYKRPKFEISFDNIQGQFVLGDSVTVTGKAKTFTGSPLDQATVRYTVERNNYYYYWREQGNKSRDAVLAEGTVIANDTGGFRFTFKANRGDEQETEYERNTNFNIHVDVTDISGETHDAEKSISVGKEALRVNSYFEHEGMVSATDSISIGVTNYDDEKIIADADVKIYKLEKPEHFLRERKFPEADTVAYSQEAWKKLLPEDLYRDENETENWKRTLIFTAKYNTGSKLPLPVTGEEKWTSGMYQYEVVVHDKNGAEIKNSETFTRYRADDKKADPYQFGTLRNVKSFALPGEKAIFSFGTPFENANLLVEAKAQGKYVFRKWMKPGLKLSEISIPVTEECRGGMLIIFTLVHNNRFYTMNGYVDVPKKDEKKNIEIVFETFRNKLTPGQKEEWRLKIKGEKGEKLAAEMVAAMYDASLDEFSPNNWRFDPWMFDFSWVYGSTWTDRLGEQVSSELYDPSYSWGPYFYWPEYESFNWFGYMNDYDWYRGNRFGYVTQNVNGQTKTYTWSDSNSETLADSIQSIRIGGKAAAGSGTYYVKVTDVNGSSSGVIGSLNFTAPGVINIGDEPMGGEERSVRMEDGVSYMWSPSEKKVQSAKPRKNLGETVFFYPHLLTDSTGTIIISFTMNEALSKWKLMTFAHTKDLRYAEETREVVTQKELMVMPNAPRFFREGDQITFTARLANLSDKDLSGTAQLQLFDATTMKPVDAQFANVKTEQNFSAKKGMGTALSWNLHIPEGIGAVTYRISATVGNFTDGEESAIPVLSNRMLVTETLPLSISGKQTKDFRFEKLISQNGGSKTLRNEKLTLEFTSNPAWYAVQSLPYMMEYPYECAEQTFNRYYSNSLATNIANASPKLRSVFDAWKNKSPDAFLSNLEKNQELKQLMLTETPWVLEAKDESERKRRVGLLFDANHMANETGKALSKLKLLQYDNGAWPWFENMPEDRYITQYIIAGFGHLDRLGVTEFKDSDENQMMLEKAISWMDQQMQNDYDYILQHDKANKDKDHLGYLQIQYLYARSFFPEMPVDAANKTAYNYYLAQAKKFWTGKGRYMEGMLSLALFRNGETKTAANILKSLSETALHSGELGMYWKENVNGWYWYQAGIETQSLLIEAFKEVNKDTAAVDQMRIWLLKNKQVNDWKTTRATADACYALLLDGTNWLATESDVTIIVASQQLDLKKSEVKEEAGTGYFKTAWNGTDVKPEMGNVKITKSGPGVSWGAMYWQYFEEMDKITPAKSPMAVTRKLFLQKKTSTGIVLEPVTAATVLHPGDQLKVRIELKNDREMEYVHLKDMRASGFEPVNVFSQYKYQDGLGYYESTKDASTDFFFAYLPKGVHVFEYPLTVIHAGDFSMGIASAECMYAPEFAAHSEGQRVLVK